MSICNFQFTEQVLEQITEVSRVFLSVFHLEVEIQVVTLETTGEIALKLTACSTILF